MNTSFPCYSQTEVLKYVQKLEHENAELRKAIKEAEAKLEDYEDIAALNILRQAVEAKE